MTRLATRFDTLREQGRTALIPYITAGDPAPDATVGFMHALVEAGADAIEVGVPFSDPMADGPVIQGACERALAAGTSLSRVLDMVAEFRERDAQTPIVLMGYLNPIDRLGLDTFSERAAAVGVDGVLIVDMTAEEAPEVAPTLQGAGLDAVCLIAPTTGDARIERICANAGGFIYYVSFKGVTGSSSLDVSSLAEKIERIRAKSALPVAVGFGVSTPDNAADVSRVADAVVVGSALVRQIAEHGTDRSATEAALRDTLSVMRRAIDEQDNSTGEARRA
ncbi:tryptophan synthase subunit alpha [Endozoicomonas sp. G2_2]|uniref:tryptophan synthase subunit alpha n=1 Tax=Endozoicomonas sp. G2_2 TaxID=2821092 RepID=UPI001ADBC9CC|nr:tryptophan synthase subunit alpha [Endozoicomonas sp. G2_2]MBO9468948.1 tryptophan synthase subunit alpha [Endozoicomonas sp. G2_2]